MLAVTEASASTMRAHQDLIRYWASLRQGGCLPSRRDIRPDGFKPLLPTVSLIERQADSEDYRLRLAGTELFHVFGREITGRSLGDIFSRAAADYWREELDKVVMSRRPNVGCHNLAWRGAGHLSLLWVRLPLASNGRDVDMILGYDAVVGVRRQPSDTGIRAA